ncbi:MAG TPA: chemotaxis protein CheB [Pseudonocardiaceae bacterium]|nr:chemotaxis protein CheB [Pseudonocardiaceae bacterium]
MVAASVTGPSREMIHFDLVVMVASLGGLSAVSSILTELPAAFSVPLLVVQHGRRSEQPDHLSCLLQRFTRLPVWTARLGQRRRAGRDGDPGRRHCDRRRDTQAQHHRR